MSCYKVILCLFQGSVDDGDVCPTPDAPRGQTKAPRLEMYRPAPHVIVDTGRPVKSKSSQDQQQLPDNFGVQDQNTQSKPLLSKEHTPVPSQTKSTTTVRNDYGPPPSQAHFKPSRPRADVQVPSDAQIKTSVLQNHNPVAARTHFNTSELKDDREVKSHAVQVPTKPSRPQNSNSRGLRLEDYNTVSPQTKIKPPASQYHDQLQTQAKTLRSRPAENDDVKRHKKDFDGERTHHRLNEDRDNMKRQSPEKIENRPVSASEAETAAHDADYAVKYRLGLVPRRSNEPKRKSEYQRQFQWRAFERNSPLMSAAQVRTAVLFQLLTHSFF